LHENNQLGTTDVKARTTDHLKESAIGSTQLTEASSGTRKMRRIKYANFFSDEILVGSINWGITHKHPKE
jgi:hypothetical protein